MGEEVQTARREIGWPVAIAAGLALFALLRLANPPPPAPPPVPAPTPTPAPVDSARPGPVARRTLGVATRSSPEGLVVAVVATGSAAMGAGILPGDVLVRAGGIGLQRGADGARAEVRLGQALDALAADQPLELELVRDGQPRRLLVRMVAEGAIELPLAEQLLAAGVEQLLALRRPDGLWPSYLDPERPSAATTALVAWALSRVPEDPRAAAAHAAAVELLLREHRTRDDAPARGVEDRFAPHPTRTYATALTLLAALPLPERASDAHELARWLTWAQIGEAHGVEPYEPTYGGWSYYDDPAGLDLRRRRADVSTARFALLALSRAGLPADDPVWARAELYLDATQNLTLLSRPEDPWRAREAGLRDGGFAFSPQSSKAGAEALEQDLLLVYSSYGSATADGALSLLGCRGTDLRGERGARLQVEDVRARAALGWLASRFQLEENPGFPAEAAGWKRAMLLYYQAALAEALHQAGVWRVVAFDGAARVWAAELVRTLHNRHSRLGEFRGESALMKEDSPVLAASFALLSLSAARDRLRLGSGADLVASAPPPPAPLVPEPAPGDALARGRALFQSHCAACHRDQDDGAGNGPSLVGVGDQYAAAWGAQAGAQLTRWLQEPRPGTSRRGAGRSWPAPMPPAPVPPDELDALVAWLLTRSAGLPVSEER